MRFLEKLWKEIQASAKKSPAPTLVYNEAELPLRVVRDLFTEDFERALVDDDRTLRRITGYLKKTSPHMAERVVRYKDRTPLFEAHGVDAEIRSTLHKRVDLPSGGYLIFDYAEAFTVIDVNTGRFVGSRSRTSTARLEETVTKNNVEAAKEVVRQLRLRDIGGIIVIDFVDMANPKNRATVEEALKRELERDRTKTYVVEISPLGLVEMTRQNVTEGPREILTRRCPTCEGDGTILSEASAVVDIERRLRALAGESPRTKAFRVELNARIRDMLVGPGAAQLAEIEEVTKRRFFLESSHDAPFDHFNVLDRGPLAKLQPQAAVEEGQELELKLVEVGLYDPEAGVGKLDGLDVAVAGAAKLVGKKVRVRVERVLNGTAFARLAGAPDQAVAAITAEGLAEKPTRASRSRKAVEPVAEAVEPEPGDDEPAEAVAEEAGRQRLRRRRRSAPGEAPAAAATAARSRWPRWRRRVRPPSRSPSPSRRRSTCPPPTWAPSPVPTERTAMQPRPRLRRPRRRRPVAAPAAAGGAASPQPLLPPAPPRLSPLREPCSLAPEPEDLDRGRREEDHEPAPAQAGEDDAGRLPLDRPALPDLLERASWRAFATP